MQKMKTKRKKRKKKIQNKSDVNLNKFRLLNFQKTKSDLSD